MPGKIKKMIDSIAQQSANGIPALIPLTLSKLILKGIDVYEYTETSPDDPAVIARLQQIASELGVSARI